MAKAKTPKTKAKAESTPPAPEPKQPRRLKLNRKQRRHVAKQKAKALPRVSGAYRLFARSLQPLTVYWKLFGGILLVYSLLSLAFVQGFGGGTSLELVKKTLTGAGQEADTVSTNVALFGTLLNRASQIGGVSQAIIMILTSLALIWALRQAYSDNPPARITIRDAFYKGMYPLVPFILVLVVMSLQLLPFGIGAGIYTSVIYGGLAASQIEAVLWTLFLGISALVSLYMLCSSLFALYIVTLPDMTPLKALRSARKLVRFRRWMLIRKIIFLPVALVLLLGLITIPLIMIAPPVAEWIFFVLTMVALIIFHCYMYLLYRELL